MGSLRPQHQNDEPTRTAMRAAGLAMIVTDPNLHDNPIVYANDAFLALTGYASDEVAGRNCRFLQGPDTSSETIGVIRRALDARQELSVDILNYRKTGEPFWNALHISPVLDAGGRLLYFFGALDKAGTRAAQRIAALERTIELQQVLIREIDHRAKNSLQMVGAMLTLQSMSIPDPAVRVTLQEMLERVDALGLVHKRLYQLSQVARFDLADFIAEVVRDIVGASGRKDIAVDLRLAPVVIRADAAAPVGLIVNEMVTNAVKHAFRDGRAGRLTVALAETDGVCAIDVADDGVGLGAAASPDRTFGTTLVETLALQLHATVGREPLEPGTLVRVRFATEPPRG